MVPIIPLIVFSVTAAIIVGVCCVAAIGVLIVASKVQQNDHSYSTPSKSKQNEQIERQEQQQERGLSLEQKLGNKRNTQLAAELLESYSSFEYRMADRGTSGHRTALQNYESWGREFKVPGLQSPGASPIAGLLNDRRNPKRNENVGDYQLSERLEDCYEDAQRRNEIFVSQSSVDNHNAIKESVESRNNLYVHPHIIALEKARRDFLGTYTKLANSLEQTLESVVIRGASDNKTKTKLYNEVLAIKTSYRAMIRVLKRNKEQLEKHKETNALSPEEAAIIESQIQSCEADIYQLNTHPLFTQAIDRTPHPNRWRGDLAFNAGQFLSGLRASKKGFPSVVAQDRLSAEIGLQRQMMQQKTNAKRQGAAYNMNNLTLTTAQSHLQGRATRQGPPPPFIADQRTAVRATHQGPPPPFIVDKRTTAGATRQGPPPPFIADKRSAARATRQGSPPPYIADQRTTAGATHQGPPPPYIADQRTAVRATHQGPPPFIADKRTAARATRQGSPSAYKKGTTSNQQKKGTQGRKPKRR